MLSEIIEMVKRVGEKDKGGFFICFDTEVLVKTTPHTEAFHAWAVCVSPGDELWVMDSEEDWYKVQERDTLLIPSLYQRISTISNKKVA
jgi:hypothetical protein